MKRGSVAVMMTVYNDRANVVNAIRSILAQDFADFEFVVVDDGSDDGTPELLDEEARRDPRLRVVRAGRLGRGAALRVAFEATGAEFVANLDSDDLSLPARLRLQREFLQAHPRVGMVGSWGLLEDGRGRHLVAYPVRDGILRRTLARFYPFVHSGVMYRRSAVEEAGGFSAHLSCCLDYDLASRVALGYELANLPEALCVLRKHPDRFFARIAREEFKRVSSNVQRQYIHRARLSAVDRFLGRLFTESWRISRRLRRRPGAPPGAPDPARASRTSP